MASICHLSRLRQRPLLKHFAHRILLSASAAESSPPLSQASFHRHLPSSCRSCGSTPSDSSRHCHTSSIKQQKESSVHSKSAKNGSVPHSFQQQKEASVCSRATNGEVRPSSVYRSLSQHASVTQKFPASRHNDDQNIRKRITEKEENLTAAEDHLHRTDQAVVNSDPFWCRMKSGVKNVASMTRNDWSKKLSHWKADTAATLKHYWVGTKLLGTDMKIALKLFLKLAKGDNLTRRERHQLKRTTSDMEAQQKILTARRQYAMHLQDIVREMAKEIKSTQSGESKETAENLDEFMNKVRTGNAVSNEEILGFAKLFNDEITLENISRPRLISMCKYMGIKPYGTDSYLRYMLQSKLKRIKNDDRLIQSEGVNSLSTVELESACRDRAILGVLTEEEMRNQVLKMGHFVPSYGMFNVYAERPKLIFCLIDCQLKDWLDLSLKFSVPSSLLILSRAFTVSGKAKLEDVVQATLSSLPDEVINVVSVSSLTKERKMEEHIENLESVKQQDGFIQKAEEDCKEGRTK